MMEYCIVEWENEPAPVVELITEGWRPQGGVAIVAYQNFDDRTIWRYIQAMVRETPHVYTRAEAMAATTYRPLPDEPGGLK